MGNAAALGCRTPSDFAAACTALPYFEEKGKTAPSGVNAMNPVLDWAAQTALCIHTCIQQASFPGAENDGVEHMSGMTNEDDIPVGDPVLAVSIPATAAQM